MGENDLSRRGLDTAVDTFLHSGLQQGKQLLEMTATVM
jgi:hypothetical protein